MKVRVRAKEMEDQSGREGKILLTFLLYGGQKLDLNHTNVCKIPRLCRATLCLHLFSTNHFQTWQLY